ncbi:MAG: hypothetical protein ACLTR6_10610 [Clostridium fessum]
MAGKSCGTAQKQPACGEELSGFFIGYAPAYNPQVLAMW